MYADMFLNTADDWYAKIGKISVKYAIFVRE